MSYTFLNLLNTLAMQLATLWRKPAGPRSSVSFNHPPPLLVYPKHLKHDYTSLTCAILPFAIAQRQPNLNLTPEEKRVFYQLFQIADTTNLGVITGEIAVSFFEKTHLPGGTLGEVWNMRSVA